MRDGFVVFEAGCYANLRSKHELSDGQIVLRSFTGQERSGDDCAAALPIELRIGPDVVDVSSGTRFALIGDRYRQIDFCGVNVERCVAFSSVPVAVACTKESLRFATLGMYDSVVPFDILQCERPWALISMDPCGGYSGSRNPFCEDSHDLVLMFEQDDMWVEAGFDPDVACGAPEGTGFEADDIPAWVCD